SLVNSETESNEDGYRSTQDLAVFMDKEGTASTVLRPAGIADFDGVRLNVSSEGDYIPAGTKIRIIKVEGAKILVRAI
ncbi:MAG: NfeD family protein, partial [Clostridia bacterium]|nr:NfeD family protein [Clostridia bacterium]